MAKDPSLKLYEPKWGSKLTNIILELEQLRHKKLGGPVPPYIFVQVKNIFQMMESLGSARIEGNRTTFMEFVERIIEKKTKLPKEDTQFKEVLNIEAAIDFVEEHVEEGTPITRALLSEVHKIVVKDLPPPPDGEGSHTPGAYRTIPVGIREADHTPPEFIRVPDLMEELLTFVNTPVESKNDLLINALAHHRAAWIHPFDNGNGRVIRLFTYALLIKQGFEVKDWRILNPTAIFCNDRQKYYDMLALADTGEEEQVLAWCEYVLTGLLDEIKKIDRLLDREYMTKEILIPALAFARERELITEREHGILRTVVTAEDMTVKAGDLEEVIGDVTPLTRSRAIRDLRKKEMLVPLKENGRVYTIQFMNNYLLRGIGQVLLEKGFVPASLNQK